jgi:hypothetical protein
MIALAPLRLPPFCGSCCLFVSGPFFIRGWCCTATSAHWGTSAAALPCIARRLPRHAPGIAGAAAASAIAGCRCAASGPAPSMRRRQSFQGPRNKYCVNAANSAPQHRVAMSDRIGPIPDAKSTPTHTCTGRGHSVESSMVAQRRELDGSTASEGGLRAAETAIRRVLRECGCDGHASRASVYCRLMCGGRIL